MQPSAGCKHREEMCTYVDFRGAVLTKSNGILGLNFSPISFERRVFARNFWWCRKGNWGVSAQLNVLQTWRLSSQHTKQPLLYGRHPCSHSPWRNCGTGLLSLTHQAGELPFQASTSSAAKSMGLYLYQENVVWQKREVEIKVISVKVNRTALM